MKLLKILLYTLLGLVALVVVLGLFAKKNYHIERSLDIKAPNSIVSEQITCFKNFGKWSPWNDIDPNMKITIPENDCQVGAVYSWVGNDQVGSGSQTLKAISADRAEFELKFLEPWESSVPTTFSFVEKDGTTKTTWGIDMTMPFPWNAFAMFTDMDKSMGADFDKGLAKLKIVCEEIAAHPKYMGYEVTQIDVPARVYTGIRQTVGFADMDKFFHENMPNAAVAAAKAGAQMAGPATGIFWTYDEKTMKSDCATAVPIASAEKLSARVPIFKINGGRAAVINYYGSFNKTGDAHNAMGEYLAKNGLKSIPPSLEEYITDPGMEKDTAKWLTKVIYFVEPAPAEPEKQ